MNKLRIKPRTNSESNPRPVFKYWLRVSNVIGCLFLATANNNASNMNCRMLHTSLYGLGDRMINQVALLNIGCKTANVQRKNYFAKIASFRRNILFLHYLHYRDLI
jgi:hypothetical protein